MAKDDPVTCCDYCQKPLGHKDEWIGLNRWVVNSPVGTRLVSIDSNEGYIWDEADRSYSCRALCHPHCLLRWIDGQLIEIKAKRKSG